LIPSSFSISSFAVILEGVSSASLVIDRGMNGSHPASTKNGDKPVLSLIEALMANSKSGK